MLDQLKNSTASKQPHHKIDYVLRVRVIFFAVISFVMCSNVLNYGTIDVYIAMKFKGDSTYDNTSKYTMLIFPIWWICQFVTMTLVGLKPMTVIGIKWTVFIGFFQFSLTNFSCIFITNIHLFIWVYSLGCGFSLGIVMLIPMYLIWNAFIEELYTYSFVSMALCPLSVIILGPLATYIINPKWKDLDDPALIEFDHKFWVIDDTVKQYFQLTSAGYLLLTLINTILVPSQQLLNNELLKLIEITENLQMSSTEQIEHKKEKPLAKGEKKYENLFNDNSNSIQETKIFQVNDKLIEKNSAYEDFNFFCSNDNVNNITNDSQAHNNIESTNTEVKSITIARQMKILPKNLYINTHRTYGSGKDLSKNGNRTHT